MAGNYGANQYKQTQVKTANRGQVLLMLYEAAIANVKKASLAIDKKDIAVKGMAIGKAHDIINELVATLDFNIGGEVARNLERLYNFMTEQLVKANLENSKEKLQTVQKLLETLLEGWKGAVEQVNKNGGASAG
ncbi:MAG: flagellar export chaperone FliS [Oligoflexia bacterium]|nr:flagellar export chaperone FliS [Oligoflexia bacterium]